jgi:hypothetical protein
VSNFSRMATSTRKTSKDSTPTGTIRDTPKTKTPTTAAPEGKKGRPATPPGLGHDDIARRAYELYDERGRADGHHEEDWQRAERELRDSRST